MVDANYLEYGQNALRVTDSIGDVIEFGSQNGYELGTLIAIFLVMFFLILILALMIKYGRKLLP